MIGGLDWLVASSPSHSNERDERCKKYSGPNSQICTHANIERDVNGHWAGCGGRLRTVGEHDFVRRRRSNAQVDLQSTGNHGAQCAGSADLLLQMDLAVAFAFVAAREPTPAHFADERLLAGVGPYVGGQVVTATERPQTYPTLERLLAGVDAHRRSQLSIGHLYGRSWWGVLPGLEAVDWPAATTFPVLLSTIGQLLFVGAFACLIL
ncbi:conserved hypothetical protein [Trichinella spiralis]|uniref:hypothetical protein n=1 Tax=Trichinella spiralis TaxID=6334 RepID=UPI0001EFB319|nr:conserved hypothetical protein [Trichinella spiralis]